MVTSLRFLFASITRPWSFFQNETSTDHLVRENGRWKGESVPETASLVRPVPSARMGRPRAGLDEAACFETLKFVLRTEKIPPG